MSDPAPEPLIRQILAGDEAACSRLVEAYAPAVYARIVRQARDPDEADDLAQEVFLAALSQLHQLRHPQRFKPWLLRIADNAVRMWRRRRMIQTRMEELWEGARTPDDPDDEARRHRVRLAIRRLSDAHRQVIVHHYFKGCSYRDTADLLGLEVDVVRNRLQKARQRLKQEISEMNGKESLPLSIALNREDMTMLRSAARFVSRDPARPNLTGMYCDLDGRVIATDGHRLFLWTSERLAGLPVPLLLGPWGDMSIPEADAGTLVVAGENVAVRIPGSPEQSAQVMADRFPDYKRAIPSEWPMTVQVHTADLLCIIDRIAEQLHPRHPVQEGTPWVYNPAVEIRVSAVERTLSLGTTRDMGYSHHDGQSVQYPPSDPVGDWLYRVSIPAACEGMGEADRFRIWVDHLYLQEAIQAFEAAGVASLRARFIAPDAGMVFLPADRDDRLVLQMPLRMVTDR